MITVATWLWEQPLTKTKYTAAHVNIWASMVSRNLSMKHRLVCVTDIPKGIDPSVEIIPPTGEFVGLQTPTWCNAKPNCFRRLVMFRKDAAKTFGERFVSMDLDVVIGAPLDPLFDRKEDLVLYKGTSPKRPYNGSMMLMTAGARPEVYETFNLAEAGNAGLMFYGSDQSWLAYKLGWDEATWDESDGVYFWGKSYKPRRHKPKVLFFPGKLKPWVIAPAVKFIRENYLEAA